MLKTIPSSPFMFYNELKDSKESSYKLCSEDPFFKGMTGVADLIHCINKNHTRWNFPCIYKTHITANKNYFHGCGITIYVVVFCNAILTVCYMRDISDMAVQFNTCINSYSYTNTGYRPWFNTSKITRSPPTVTLYNITSPIG